MAEIQHINATLSCDSLILEGAHCTLQSAHCTRKHLNISNLYLSWCSIFQSLWADAVDFCQSWKSVDHWTQLPLPWHDFITAMRDKEFWKFHWFVGKQSQTLLQVSSNSGLQRSINYSRNGASTVQNSKRSYAITINLLLVLISPLKPERQLWDPKQK